MPDVSYLLTVTSFPFNHCVYISKIEGHIFQFLYLYMDPILLTNDLFIRTKGYNGGTKDCRLLLTNPLR